MLPHAMLISIAWSGALCVRLVGPAVSLSVLCQHRLAVPATMAVGQHAVRVGKSIPVPTWTRLHFRAKME